MKNLILFSIMFIMCSHFYGICGEAIEEVNDTELVHLLAGENNVIVLFTKNSCKICREWELLLERVQKDLKESLEAVIVKVHDSNMISIYNPSKEPSLIFYRHGIPLLYHGEINDDEVLQTFSDNREPAVKELSDVNFEHLTQASTGATTGDWFVFFYSADCTLCQRLYALWEAVGSKLKHKLNVARMNRLDSGMLTAKRLGITTSPSFILLRLGKIYRYKKNDFTPRSLIEFAEYSYRIQTSPEPVPADATLLDHYISEYISSFAESSYIYIFGAVILFVISLAYLGVKFLYVKNIDGCSKSLKKK